MARATKTPRIATRRELEPAPTKGIGRPLGLKQAAREEALDAAPAPVGKIRQAPKRAAASTMRRGARAIMQPAAEAPAAKAAAKRTARGGNKSKSSRVAELDVA